MGSTALQSGHVWETVVVGDAVWDQERGRLCGGAGKNGFRAAADCGEGERPLLSALSVFTLVPKSAGGFSDL